MSKKLKSQFEYCDHYFCVCVVTTSNNLLVYFVTLSVEYNWNLKHNNQGELK